MISGLPTVADVGARLRERRHRGLARRCIAVRRRAIFVMPKIQCPPPRRNLEDAADDSAVRQREREADVRLRMS